MTSKRWSLGSTEGGELIRCGHFDEVNMHSRVEIIREWWRRKEGSDGR